MSGADDARALLEAVGGYVETPPGAAPPSQDRPVRLATVAPGYSGTGPVPVVFDGEALAGLRQYVPLAPVASGQRVVLLPVGATYVVLGRVDGPTIGSSAGPGFLEVATPAETIALAAGNLAVSPEGLGAIYGARRLTKKYAFSGVTTLDMAGCFPDWATSLRVSFSAAWPSGAAGLVLLRPMIGGGVGTINAAFRMYLYSDWSVIPGGPAASAWGGDIAPQTDNGIHLSPPTGGSSGRWGSDVDIHRQPDTNINTMFSTKGYGITGGVYYRKISSDGSFSILGSVKFDGLRLVNLHSAMIGTVTTEAY